MVEKVRILREEISVGQKETADINKFMRLVKSYTEITELKPEIVRTFIDKIYVHKGEVAQGRHRAMDSLAIVYYTDDVDKVYSTLLSNECFKRDEIIRI